MSHSAYNLEYRGLKFARRYSGFIVVWCDVGHSRTKRMLKRGIMLKDADNELVLDWLPQTHPRCSSNNCLNEVVMLIARVYSDQTYFGPKLVWRCDAAFPSFDLSKNRLFNHVTPKMLSSSVSFGRARRSFCNSLLFRTVGIQRCAIMAAAQKCLLPTPPGPSLMYSSRDYLRLNYDVPWISLRYWGFKGSKSRTALFKVCKCPRQCYTK